MFVNKKLKIVIAIIVFTITLSAGKVFASSDPGQQFKIWYNHLFQQTISVLVVKVDEHRQSELEELAIIKDGLLDDANSQLAETATEVSLSASQAISLHSQNQIQQLLESRDIIINNNIESDFQTYTDQKIEQIQVEIFSFLIEIVNELD